MITEKQADQYIPENEHAWGYQELAILYFPNIKPESAARQLRRWIMFSKELETGP